MGSLDGAFILHSPDRQDDPPSIGKEKGPASAPDLSLEPI
jgi:hypothetical protein